MVQSTVLVSETSPSYASESLSRQTTFPFASDDQLRNLWLGAIKRRWRRERRRRKVGRAYDMALEIARLLPAKARVLDVGCGSGFIAHHLSAMVGTNVVGIDLEPTTEAAIAYRQFDGRYLPIGDGSVDVVLLCYVLHHAQDVDTVMKELQRVLACNGQAIVYEDIPSTWWDRLVCWTHNLKWRKRTGPCAFRCEFEWNSLFTAAGFEVIAERPLSRWRNFAHPVCRRFYLLRRGDPQLAVN